MPRENVVTITVRLSPEEHALLRDAAAADRRSINAFVVRTVLRQARTVLRREQAGEESGDGR